MLEFAENLRIMVGTLGFKFFEPLITKKRADKSDTFFLQGARGASGRGIPTSEGFVVSKGSQLASTTVPSTPPVVTGKGDALLADGSVDHFVLTKDVLFNSPSLAAAVLLGRSANGQVEWKLKSGTTLKEAQAATGIETWPLPRADALRQAAPTVGGTGCRPASAARQWMHRLFEQSPQ